ncbi:alpha-hydroxy-acid oxidizing protein [Georgenia ruanii]|uniref:Alpha-hydroxy-acid oxidizing protein n=1 Tax=Georgenia ruanii TaxID=348442 RepID=A0A7J9UV36_9MICO|nr:alpha-hydroxy-acid oxidizing protein [Georgenia ruanii]
MLEVIDGGAGDETTLAANRADLEAMRLVPRNLEDVREVDLSTTVLGQRMAMPFMFAPCSYARMCHPAAERAVAEAAGRSGVGYIVPGGASEPLDAVAAAATGPLWYQIYLSPDMRRNEDLISVVRANRYQALVVSVDTPMMPYRERDMRNGISFPLTVTARLALAGMSRPVWAKNFVLGNKSAGFSLTAARRAYYSFETAMSGLRPVTLDDLGWLRARWDGPLVVKGLLGPDKVREMVSLGVDAVVVSNHGARNLDGVVSTASAVRSVVDAVAGDLEVLVDGGVRRGIDVVRMRALGATASLVGRPYLHGLAAAGPAGVARVARLLRDEVHVALAFLGLHSFDQITPEVLAASSAAAGHGLNPWRS